MKKVYYYPIESIEDTEEIKKASKLLLKKIIEEEKISLNDEIPLKVHFGEKGNKTFIKADNYDGIIDFLEKKNIKRSFIETNVLYRSDRTKKDTHIEVAKNHGFTRLPIIIADGESGEGSTEIEINKKHFKKCKIGKRFLDYDQYIILSHVKAHSLAGFGGAIKQLAMGFASRGGKLDQHANSFPKLNPSICKKCKICEKNCPADAIIIDENSKIDKEKCIGCAACIAICPHNAIKIDWGSTPVNEFLEKLAEYAYAAQLGKKMIYFNFCLNIASGCDCVGNSLDLIAKDVGIFASVDPVAIDKACVDILEKNEGREVFEGKEVIDYAQEIGLGSSEYELINILE